MTCLLILMRSSTLIDARQIWPPSAMVHHARGGADDEGQSPSTKREEQRRCPAPCATGISANAAAARHGEAHVPARSAVDRRGSRQGRPPENDKHHSPLVAPDPTHNEVNGGGSSGAGRRWQTPTPTPAPAQTQPPSRLHARRPPNTRRRPSDGVAPIPPDLADSPRSPCSPRVHWRPRLPRCRALPLCHWTPYLGLQKDRHPQRAPQIHSASASPVPQRRPLEQCVQSEWSYSPSSAAPARPPCIPPLS